ncbi:MAG TPA: DUF4335 domain-containing protein, partial [Chroococcidiopsis sp.]
GTASDLLPLAPPSAAAPALPGLVAPAIASASERTSPLEPEREMAFSTPAAQPSLVAQPSPAAQLSAKTGISIKPVGLVSHDLYLGTLANDESGMRVRLSTLQLFDLANALDDYSADVLALPATTRTGWLNTPKPWLQAVAVLVLAVGVSTSLFKLIGNVSPSLEATSDAPSNVASQGTTGATKPDGTDDEPGDWANFPSPVAGASPSAAASPRAGAPAAGTAPAPATPTPTQSIAPLPNLAPVTRGSEDRASEPFAAAPQAAPNVDTALAPNAPAAMSRQGGAAESFSSNGNAAESSSTLFDNIPQVVEVRDYFQGRWQPPADLSQSLEYRLTIDANGALQSVTPLGRVSRSSIDQVGMPAVGQAFVSPLSAGQRATIRLVLTPEGRVQTFLESAN